MDPALASAVAWPLVALMSLAVLVKTGILERIFEMLFKNIGTLKVVLDDMKKVSTGTLSDIETKTLDLKKAVAELSDEINKIPQNLSQQLLEIKGILSAASIERDIDLGLAEVVDSDVRAMTSSLEVAGMTLPNDGAGVVAAAATDQIGEENSSGIDSVSSAADLRYSEIYGSWRAVVEALQRALRYPEDFDQRQIGAMAYRLTDRRRKNYVASTDADEIAALHSKFKRIARLRASDPASVDQAVMDEFLDRAAKIKFLLESGI